VLHSHHNLASLSNSAFILPKTIEMPKNRKQLETCKKQDFTLSTSTHSIEDFNELDPAFDYAFISPVFTSISKENITQNRFI
jgi:thiamine-phosphate pyrophosphorylase